jgi:hypothetical protein
MSVESGFDDLQKLANASSGASTEARRRRDVFMSALLKAADVIDVFPSGTLPCTPDGE